MKHVIPAILSILTALSIVSCEKSINDERIPPVSVNIELNNQGLWDTYGVHGYGQHRYFIKVDQIPENFPYTALTYTGFGGVLLISGYADGDYNVPLAYDLSCPVESKQTVRIQIDSESYEAVCPECRSRYDVCEGNGRPVSGRAVDLNFGLQRYRVIPASLGGYTIVY